MLNVGTLIAVLRLRDDMSPALRNMRRSINNHAASIARGVGAATATVTGLGVVSIKAASDFESSFAGVRKTVNATEDEFAALSQEFRDMSREIPVNVNELNRIGEAAGQLGIKTENISTFTRTMADLGVTTNLSAEQAATALARLANITGLPQDQIDRLGSTIVALGNNFATTEAEIVEFGTRLAGAGAVAGLTEADILAIGAAMSSVGVEAEAGGTAVQKVLLGIQQAVVLGGEDVAAFAEVAGMSAQDFSDAWRQDAGSAFTAFVEGLGNAGDDAITILSDLDLTDQRLIRSFLSLSGAGDLLANTMKEGSAAFAENTALGAEAAQRYDTFASKMTIFKNTVQDLAISIGQRLMPIASRLLEWAQDMVAENGGVAGLADAFGNRLPRAVSFLVDATVVLSRGFRGLEIIARNVTDAIVVAFQSLVGVMLEVLEPLLKIQQGMAIATGDVGKLAQATAALTSVQNLANATWDTAGETLLQMEARVRESLEAQNLLEGSIKSMGAELVAAVTPMTDYEKKLKDIAAAHQSAKDAANNHAKKIKEGFTPAIDAAKDSVAKWGSAIGATKADRHQWLTDFELYEQNAVAADSAQRQVNVSVQDFAGVLRTGNQLLDTFIGMALKAVDSLIGGGGLSFGFGQAAEAGGGFFSKITSGLSGLLGGGGLLSAGIGLAAAGISKLIGLFGVSEIEKEGRAAAVAFRDSVRSELSADVLAQVQLQFPGDVQNAAFLASIQQKLIAAGMAAEAAGVQAQQFGQQLWEAEKQGGAAVSSVIAQIEAATAAAAQATTDTVGAATDALADIESSTATAFSGVRGIINEAMNDSALDVQSFTTSFSGAMGEVLDAAQNVSNKMVGSSIWTDMTDEMKAQNMSVADSFGDQARRMVATASSAAGDIARIDALLAAGGLPEDRRRSLDIQRDVLLGSGGRSFSASTGGSAAPRSTSSRSSRSGSDDLLREVKGLRHDFRRFEDSFPRAIRHVVQTGGN